MGDSLLQIEGLRVKNDGDRTVRQFALDIDSLEVRPNDCILILADRCHGKSALRASLKAIFCQPLTEGNNLDIPQCEESKPIVHVDSLFRREDACFHEQGGDPKGLQAVEDRSTIIYCDDPLFPHTQNSSSREILDTVRKRSLTMMMASDPDRLQGTLEYLLTHQTSRILWLCNGRVFWNGLAGEFHTSVDALCGRYRSEAEQGRSTENFLRTIHAATQRFN
ncbi:MAG: hypothetical protein HY268_20285 [Deltaproteobacteria bacterium]|nr:hypothetical protein [Deltaproteobacteria bacterium]